MLRVPDSIGAREQGFDGQFFLALARDPIVTPRTQEELDLPVVRATRIGYPAAAHLLGRLTGSPERALITIQTLSMAAVLSLIQYRARTQQLPPALAYAVALSLPFVLSMELVTAELPAAAMLTLGFAAATRRRHALSASAIALAALTKEVSALAALSFASVAAVRRQYRQALAYVAAVLPLVLWYAFLIARVETAEPGTALMNNISVPGLGPLLAVHAHFKTILAGSAVLKSIGLLTATAWYLVGVALALVVAVKARVTGGRMLVLVSGALVLLLSNGPRSTAYDEVFNFGRQLFLLEVAAIGIYYFEAHTLTLAQQRYLAVWIGIGGLLGAAWWLQEIGFGSMGGA
jgi:hypothetical protein